MVRLFLEAIYKFFKRSESSCGAANLDSQRTGCSMTACSLCHIRSKDVRTADISIPSANHCCGSRKCGQRRHGCQWRDEMMTSSDAMRGITWLRDRFKNRCLDITVFIFVFIWFDALLRPIGLAVLWTQQGSQQNVSVCFSSRRTCNNILFFN